MGPNGTIAASTGYDSPTFSWHSVAGADHYAVIVIDNSASNTIAFSNFNVNSTSLTSSVPLTPGHGYTWYVGAVSTNGQATTYDVASPQSFTLAPLTAPTPTNPSGTINTTTPTFSWTSVTAANHYAFVVVDTTANNKVVMQDLNVNGTSAPSSAPLTSGHSYTWYAAAVSNDGTYFWSGGLSFDVV
jgi:hypothetical protein